MLKAHFAGTGVGRLSGLFGKTRQAYYERNWYYIRRSEQAEIILEMVRLIRREMPRIGVKKLYRLIKTPMRTHGIKTGRDALYQLLQEHDLLVKARRKRIITTYADQEQERYPNLIRSLEVTKAGQLWVSDITYISVGNNFNYLSLVTDAYSRKIIGHCLYPTLERHGPLAALDMALATHPGNEPGLIHHSDRGRQYGCGQYTLRLKNNNIRISMTEKKDPYENAIAERVNGILKTEFMLNRIFCSTQQAQEIIAEVVRIYNESRPHMSCNYLTPAQAHLQTGVLERKWKNYYNKQSDNEAK